MECVTIRALPPPSLRSINYRLHIYIYNTIQNRGCSEPFLEVGPAEFHNEDYVFSNEISLKFPNHQKFSMCRQISPSKKWHELDWKHCHEVDSWREGEARFTNSVFSPEREARFTNPMPLPEREARFTDPMPLPEREARSTNHTNASAPGPSAPPAPAELELVYQ